MQSNKYILVILFISLEILSASGVEEETSWLDDILHEHGGMITEVGMAPEKYAAAFQTPEEMEKLRILLRKASGEISTNDGSPLGTNPDDRNAVDAALRILEVKAYKEDYNLVLDVMKNAVRLVNRGQAASTLAAIDPERAIGEIERAGHQVLDKFDNSDIHGVGPYCVALSKIGTPSARESFDRLKGRHAEYLSRHGHATKEWTIKSWNTAWDEVNPIDKTKSITENPKGAGDRKSSSIQSTSDRPATDQTSVANHSNLQGIILTLVGLLIAGTAAFLLVKREARDK